MIKANSKAMKKLTAAILTNKPTATPTAAGNSSIASLSKAAKRAEMKKNAATCPHCHHIHPNCMHDQYWEFPANVAKRPVNWKSVKSP